MKKPKLDVKVEVRREGSTGWKWGLWHDNVESFVSSYEFMRPEYAEVNARQTIDLLNDTESIAIVSERKDYRDDEGMFKPNILLVDEHKGWGWYGQLILPTSIVGSAHTQGYRDSLDELKEYAKPY